MPWDPRSRFRESSVATTLKLPDGGSIALADWIATSLTASFVVHVEDMRKRPIWQPFDVAESQTMPGSVSGMHTVSRAQCNTPRPGMQGLPRDWEALIYRWRASTPIGPRDDLPDELRQFATTVSATFVYMDKSMDKTTLLAMLEMAPGWRVPTAPENQNRLQENFDSLAHLAKELSDHEDTKRLPIHMRDNLPFGVEFQATSEEELTKFKIWLLQDRNKLRSIADRVAALEGGASLADELRSVAGPVDANWNKHLRDFALFTVHLEGLLKRPVQ